MAYRVGKGGHLIKDATLTFGGTAVAQKLFVLQANASVASLGVEVSGAAALTSTVEVYATNRPLDGGPHGINPEVAQVVADYADLDGAGWTNLTPSADGNVLGDLDAVNYAIYLVVVTATAGAGTFQVFLHSKVH